MTEISNFPQRFKISPNDEIKITLRWNKCGFWRRLIGQSSVDLDLGCYYKLESGYHTLIDCLQFRNGLGGSFQQQTKQGCFTQPPYIWHTGDVDGSNEVNEETLRINGQGINELSKIIIYAYVFDGPAHWEDINPEISIYLREKELFSLPIRADKEHRFAALLNFDIVDNLTVEISLLNTLHHGHADCDRHYGWGFKYHEEKKD